MVIIRKSSREPRPASTNTSESECLLDLYYRDADYLDEERSLHLECNDARLPNARKGNALSLLTAGNVLYNLELFCIYTHVTKIKSCAVRLV